MGDRTKQFLVVAIITTLLGVLTLPGIIKQIQAVHKKPVTTKTESVPKNTSQEIEITLGEQQTVKLKEGLYLYTREFTINNLGAAQFRGFDLNGFGKMSTRNDIGKVYAVANRNLKTLEDGLGLSVNNLVQQTHNLAYFEDSRLVVAMDIEPPILTASAKETKFKLFVPIYCSDANVGNEYRIGLYNLKIDLIQPDLTLKKLENTSPLKQQIDNFIVARCDE